MNIIINYNMKYVQEFDLCNSTSTSEYLKKLCLEINELICGLRKLQRTPFLIKLVCNLLAATLTNKKYTQSSLYRFIPPISWRCFFGIVSNCRLNRYFILVS